MLLNKEIQKLREEFSNITYAQLEGSSPKSASNAAARFERCRDEIIKHMSRARIDGNEKSLEFAVAEANNLWALWQEANRKS